MNPHMSFGRTPIVRSLVFCTLVLVVGLLTPAVVPAQPKVPEPLAFAQGKDSPGPVTFNHAKHRDSGVDKCTACHTKVFKMKKGTTPDVTMAKMDAGESCGTCHNGKTQVGSKVVFTTKEKANCEKCHKK